MYSHAFASVHYCHVVTCCERAVLLALVDDVYCIFVTFPSSILCQVWYFIVPFPDLCRLSFFQGQLSIYAGQMYCRLLQREHSANFRPSLSYHLSLISMFCLFLSGRLRQVLLYTKHLREMEAKQERTQTRNSS